MSFINSTSKSKDFGVWLSPFFVPNEVIFINTFHNGDVHFSREFVKHFRSLYIGKTRYCHMQNPRVTADLGDMYMSPQELKTIYGFCVSKDKDVQFVTRRGDVLFANVWVGTNNKRYYHTYGCTLTANYALWSDLYKMLGKELNATFVLRDKAEYIPSIDYSVINRQPIDAFFERHKNKLTVFIVTSLVRSGQSPNFPFDDIVDFLSTSMPDANFIVSNRISANHKNIFQAKEITQVQGTDLIELSYISTRCDVLIGRGSGSFTLAGVKENYNSKKLIIGIGYDQRDIFWDQPKNGLFINANHVDNINTLLLNAITQSRRLCE